MNDKKQFEKDFESLKALVNMMLEAGQKIVDANLFQCSQKLLKRVKNEMEKHRINAPKRIGASIN